jgi:hypothetical protein
MTLAVVKQLKLRQGLTTAFRCALIDLGIGIGSLTMGALLDLVDQNFPSCT